MIILSQENINSRAPYQVYTIKNGFAFQTEAGIHYEITFKEDNPIGGCETWQFIIDKVDSQHQAHDPKVEHTILTILDEFFIERLDVLLYLCDTSDDRQAGRNRLFLTSFKRNAEPNRFTIHTADTIVEGMHIYAAIIVENRNPKLQAITDDFNATAEALTNKPE